MATNRKKTVLIVTSLLIIGGAVGFLLWKRSKKKKEEEERKKAEEQALLNSQSNKPSGGGSGSGSGYSAPAISNPFSDSASLKKFQQWVIDVKKDSAILGSAGADGKWGNSSANAWSKYGNEYSGVGSASSETSSNVIGKNAVAKVNTYVYSTPDDAKIYHYLYAIGTVSKDNKLGKIKGIRENKGIIWYEIDITIGLSDKNGVLLDPNSYIHNPKVGWVNSANITVQ